MQSESTGFAVGTRIQVNPASHRSLEEKFHGGLRGTQVWHDILPQSVAREPLRIIHEICKKLNFRLEPDGGDKPSSPGSDSEEIR